MKGLSRAAPFTTDKVMGIPHQVVGVKGSAPSSGGMRIWREGGGPFKMGSVKGWVPSDGGCEGACPFR